MSKLHRIPTQVFGHVQEHNNGERYVLIYSDLEEMFEDDCENQEVLVYKFSHKAKGSRTTQSRTVLTKVKR